MVNAYEYNHTLFKIKQAKKKKSTSKRLHEIFLVAPLCLSIRVETDFFMPFKIIIVKIPCTKKHLLNASEILNKCESLVTFL